MRERQHPEEHPWVTSSIMGLEAIDHERVIGRVAVTGEVVSIRLAQRVDYDLLADPVLVKPSPPRITLGGVFEMNASQALAIAEQLPRSSLPRRPRPRRSPRCASPSSADEFPTRPGRTSIAREQSAARAHFVHALRAGGWPARSGAPSPRPNKTRLRKDNRIQNQISILCGSCESAAPETRG